MDATWREKRDERDVFDPQVLGTESFCCNLAAISTEAFSPSSLFVASPCLYSITFENTLQFVEYSIKLIICICGKREFEYAMLYLYSMFTTIARGVECAVEFIIVQC